jgi:hypothetical protein
LPRDNTLDSKWNLLKNDNNSEYIFLFSLPAHNPALNSKLLSPLPPRNNVIHRKELYNRTISAKASDQVKSYNKKVRLTAIFKESKEQQELKEKETEEADHKTKLKTTDPLFLKLSCASHTEKN